MDFFNSMSPMLRSFLIVLVTTVVLFTFLKITVRIFVTRFKVWSEKTETKIDDFVIVWVEKTTTIFILVFSAYIAYHLIGEDWGDRTDRYVWNIFLAVMAVQCGIWGHHLIKELVAQLDEKIDGKNSKNHAQKPVYNVLTFTLNVFLFVTLTLVFLSNVGVNVSALVAGLGVGGIAIALALQNILGDLFASVTIALDKPFEVGDYIVMDSFKGHIEKIGIKTTRIRSATGEEIIVSNSDLLKTKIRNYHRIHRRQVSFEFGVTYETDSEKLKEIPQICKTLIQKLDLTTFDRCHFRRLGDFSLVYEIVFWVNHKEHNIQLDKTEEFLLNLTRTFKEKGINFAYPTQTLVMKKEP